MIAQSLSRVCNYGSKVQSLSHVLISSRYTTWVGMLGLEKCNSIPNLKSSSLTSQKRPDPRIRTNLYFLALIGLVGSSTDPDPCPPLSLGIYHHLILMITHDLFIQALIVKTENKICTFFLGNTNKLRWCLC